MTSMEPWWCFIVLLGGGGGQILPSRFADNAIYSEWRLQPEPPKGSTPVFREVRYGRAANKKEPLVGSGSLQSVIAGQATGSAAGKS